DRPAARETGFEAVPVADRLFAQAPAQQDVLAAAARRKVDQTQLDVLHLAAERAHLIDLLRQRLVESAKQRLRTPHVQRAVIAFQQLLAAHLDAGALQLLLDAAQRGAQLQHVGEDPLQRGNQRLDVADREMRARHSGSNLPYWGDRGDGEWASRSAPQARGAAVVFSGPPHSRAWRGSGWRERGRRQGHAGAAA